MPLGGGEVLRATVEIQLPGNVISLNVFYAQRNDVDPGFMPDDDVMEALQNGLEAIYLPITPDMVTGSAVVGFTADKVVWDAVDEKWVVSQNFAERVVDWPGQAVGDMLPQQMAAVVVASCSKVRCRPKKFFGGFNEATQADGVLIPLTVGHLVTSAAAWMAPMPDPPYSLDFVTVANDGSVQGLNGVVVNSIMGTQRRRKINVGM